METAIIKTDTLKKWVRKELRMNDDCVILISEAEIENNMPKQTVIMAYKNCENTKLQIYKINKSIEEVNENDIKDSMQSVTLFSPKRISYSDIDWKNTKPVM